MRTRKAIALILALLTVLAALPMQGALAAGTRYYVKKDGDDSKDGLSWANAKSDLKNVMAAANPGDEIWVAKGTYSPGTGVADTFLLKAGLKVYGGFAGTEGSVDARDWKTNITTLDGGGTNRHVVTGGSGAATSDTRLDGFTITGGNATGSHQSADQCGGGMYNNGSSPTVANCVFSGNEAKNLSASGGGMYNKNSSPAVENCVFSGNTSGSGGGGIFNTENSSPMVTNCIFSGNKAENGGGMRNSINSSPTVVNCAFSGNTAIIAGGMSSLSSSPMVANCTFSGNQSNDKGGGIFNFRSNTTVINCTFSGNTSRIGGGIFNEESNLTVVNTIMCSNTATSDRNSSDIWQSGGVLTLKNCLVENYSLNGGATKHEDNPITGDPKLIALDKEGNTVTNPAAPENRAKVYIYGLGGSSSAKNVGLNVGTDINGVPVPDTDQRGMARPQGAGVDIGAFEAAVPVTGVTVSPKTLTLTAGGATGILTATVYPADATNKKVTWSSSNEAVATVTNGVVTPIAAGQAIITVKTDDGNKTDTCTVNVQAATVPVTGVTVSPETLTLTAGGATGTLTAAVLPPNATNQGVTWSSSNEAVATVTDGVVTPIAAGQAVITVKTDDGGFTADCRVTVSPVSYTTVEGDGQSYTRGSGSPLRLVVGRNADDQKTFGLFQQLMMDGAPVSPGNYTREEGSLIVRLKPAWLDTLAAGLHRLSFVFRDGEARASFTIKAKPGSFEDVATPSDHFTFTKRWQGGTGSSIDWTLYDEMGYVAHKLFNKKAVSQTEWRYEAWFDRPVKRYVVEKPVPGYKTRYENVGVYAGITDRCCNGGAIINYKIPQTGDEARLTLWAGLALLGVAGMGVMLLTGRRRKADK